MHLSAQRGRRVVGDTYDSLIAEEDVGGNALTQQNGIEAERRAAGADGSIQLKSRAQLK